MSAARNPSVISPTLSGRGAIGVVINYGVTPMEKLLKQVEPLLPS